MTKIIRPRLHKPWKSERLTSDDFVAVLLGHEIAIS